jgi:hypothetical protein
MLVRLDKVETFPSVGEPIMAFIFELLLDSCFALSTLVALSDSLCGFNLVRDLDCNFTSFFGEILHALRW